MMRNTNPVAGDPAPAASVERRAQNAAAVDPLPPSLGDDLLRGAEAIAAFLFGDPKLAARFTTSPAMPRSACRTSSSAR